MSVSIADGVLAEAARRSEYERNWGIRLLVRIDAAADRAGPMFAQAREQVYLALDEEFDFSTNEEVEFGEWLWVPARQGVVVTVIESDMFDRVLPEIAGRLDAAGASGTIELWTDEAVVLQPREADLVACKILPISRLPPPGEWGYPRPEPGTAEALTTAADEWWRSSAHDAPRSLSVAGLRPIALDPDETVFDRIAQARASLSGARVFSRDVATFRGVGYGTFGDVALVVASDAELDWQTQVGEFTAVLRACATQIGYAYVIRGWDISAGFDVDHLGSDWPSGYDGRWIRRAAASDDRVALEAFGIQLLGPQYAVSADHESWAVERLESGRTLVTHREPGRWFAAPLVAPANPGKIDKTPPELLREARVQLNALL